MRRIILIAGLPSSGKTCLGKTVAHRLNGILVDDPKSLGELPEDFNTLVITDPFLCYERDQDKAEKYLYNRYQDCNWIEWVFFENDPQQCLINAKRRRLEQNSPKAVIAFINFATKHYHIRSNSIVCKVFKPEEKDHVKRTRL